jgi:multidrug efflux pump subunit AcrA (membrane-fusion protein)
MTLLGKIFTVLIFIQSLVFMSFAVAVYATHRNWKDVVMRKADETQRGEQVGLKWQLEDEQKRYERLNEEKLKLDDQLAMEKAARRQALAALESRARQLNEKLAALERRNAELVQTERQAVVAMETTQRNLDAIKGEVDLLRGQITTVSLDRDTQFNQVVALTDRVHQARTVKARLEERRVQLATELAKRKEVMDRHGISADEPAENKPPSVDGVITATSKSGLVEISIGSDDGIREGHQLEVFSGNSYLGRIKIRKVSPDRAVGETIPEYRKGDIKKGDRVATRLTSS